MSCGADLIPNTGRTYPLPVLEMAYTIWVCCIIDVVPSFVRWQVRYIDCNNMQYGGNHVVAKSSGSVLCTHGPKSWLYLPDLFYVLMISNTVCWPDCVKKTIDATQRIINVGSEQYVTRVFTFMMREYGKQYCTVVNLTFIMMIYYHTCPPI